MSDSSVTTMYTLSYIETGHEVTCPLCRGGASAAGSEPCPVCGRKGTIDEGLYAELERQVTNDTAG